MDTIKDHIIWDNFRLGSTDALEIIYEENYKPLFHYGAKFTKDDALIKDTIQELFIELINSGEKLARTYNIRFYLLGALRNKLQHQLALDLKIKSGHIDEAAFSLIEPIEAELIKKETEENTKLKIISAIKKLSVKQQEIIYLRFYNDMPFNEIANLLEVKIQTVRNLLNRAIKSLKDDFDNNQIHKQMFLFVLNMEFRPEFPS